MTDTTDTIPALAANAYHDGYIDGIKVALEFIEMADTTNRAAEALKSMLETITKKETK